MWIGDCYAYENTFYATRQGPINCVPSFAGRFWEHAREDYCALSHHPGRAQFLLADGAVRSLSEKIDGRTYELLGGRNNGNPNVGEF